MTNSIIDSILHDFHCARDLSDFAERALHETGATGVAIALKRQDRFVCCARAGETAPGIGALVDSNSGITGTCISAGVAVLCDNTASDSRVDAEVCEQLGIASLLAVPIIKSGLTVGVIEALSNMQSAFHSEQQAALEALARDVEPHDFPELFPTHEPENLETGTPDLAISISDSPMLNVSEHTAELPVVTFTGQPDEYLAKPANQGKRIRRAVLIPMMTCAALGVVFGLYYQLARKLPVNNQPLTSVAAQSSLASPVSSAQPDLSMPDAHSQADFTPIKEPVNDLEGLENAARHGDAASQMKLADILANGRGIGKDLVMACAWYTLANMAGQQDSTGQLASLSRALSNSEIGRVRIQLGEMFWNGIGVKRDVSAAYTWFLLATAAGSTEATQHERELASDMTDEQISAATQRANEWLLHHHLSPLRGQQPANLAATIE